MINCRQLCLSIGKCRCADLRCTHVASSRPRLLHELQATAPCAAKDAVLVLTKFWVNASGAPVCYHNLGWPSMGNSVPLLHHVAIRASSGSKPCNACGR